MVLNEHTRLGNTNTQTNKKQEKLYIYGEKINENITAHMKQNTTKPSNTTHTRERKQQQTQTSNQHKIKKPPETKQIQPKEQ